MQPVRKTPRLGFGRFSNPGATYFLTFVTKNRTPALIQNGAGQILTDTFLALHQSADIELLAATIMPDHVHFVFVLGRRLNLGQVTGKLKTLSRDRGRVAWRWQKDGFEHQIRRSELIENYAFYIFMNPYQAGLCPLTGQWPWWICPKPEMFQFLTSLKHETGVPSAWLAVSDKIAETIAGDD